MTTVNSMALRLPAWVAALLLLAAGGCGGGSGGIASNDGGGIGGSGISFGVVTGFGSVIVNGNTFNTDDAEIIVNGEPALESALTEGMLVRIEGDWTGDGGGVASRVEYHDDIRGPVQEVVEFDPLSGAGTIIVLGQSVRFTSQTVFRGVSRDAIAAGDDVRISGWQQDDGTYLASLIRLVGNFTEGGEAEVKGFIRDLDTLAQTFRIGTLEISYDGATEIEMRNDRDELLPEDEGEFVEVEGRFEGGVLRADEIEREDGGNRFRARPGDDIEFEGPISSVDTADRTFVIHGVTVRVTNGTEFDDGLREEDLQPGL